MPCCRELLQFLGDYLDEALPAAQRDVLQLHLDRCPACRAYLRKYRQVIRQSQQSWEAAERACEPVPEALVQAVLAARRAEADRR
jgi:anti-sigma factor RsiW